MLQSLVVSCQQNGDNYHQLKAELRELIGPWNRVVMTDPQVAMHIWDSVPDYLMIKAFTKLVAEGDYSSLLAFCVCKGEWDGVGREQT